LRRDKLEFHDADADTDAQILAIVARKSRVSDVRLCRRVGRVGVESVSVSVSAPWNASYTPQEADDRETHAKADAQIEMPFGKRGERVGPKIHVFNKSSLWALPSEYE